MAFDAFLKMKGSGFGADIKGETLDDEMSKEGFFGIIEFGFGASNTLSIGSETGGAGAGKVTFEEFTVKKRTDNGSPILFLMCCNGGHFNDVVLKLRKAGVELDKSGGNYLTFSFKLVAVQSITWSGADGDDVCEEEVVFQYGAIQIEYWSQDKAGKLTKQEKTAWSRVKNRNVFKV